MGRESQTFCTYKISLNPMIVQQFSYYAYRFLLQLL